MCIYQAIISMDERVLSMEMLQQLIALVPTLEEMGQVVGFLSDGTTSI